MEDIFGSISRMDPEEAMAQVGRALKALFSIVGEEARNEFLLGLIGESQSDKVASLVHL
jgi:hypothetical protein